jgi:ABC-type antimicrobial peptide transport system permease subunit
MAKYWLEGGLADKLGIESGDVIEIGGFRGKAAILDSGTEFDSFVIVDGIAEKSTMVLIRTDNPEKYRSGGAVILEEMVRTKFSFLRGIEKLLFYIAAVSAVSTLITIVKLSRIDAGKRRKEFGVMRAVGADTKTIGKFVFAEFGILTLLSAALGILLSFTLSWAILAGTAGTFPEFSFRSSVNLILLSATAFYAVSLIYLVESTKKDLVNELTGE